jgi:hypothetical protein
MNCCRETGRSVPQAGSQFRGLATAIHEIPGLKNIYANQRVCLNAAPFVADNPIVYKDRDVRKGIRCIGKMRKRKKEERLQTQVVSSQLLLFWL